MGGCTYWIEEWAKIRQDELVRLPREFPVHPCFLTRLERPELYAAFVEIWNIFHDVYGDIGKNPERFKMPLHRITEYGEFSSQARDSAKAAHRPISLLYALFGSGLMEKERFAVNPEIFATKNAVRNTSVLLERLSDYGFAFEGMGKKGPTDRNTYVTYPDNPDVLVTLWMMADKADRTHRADDFLCCHYKLFVEDQDTVGYGHGADVVADKMHTDEERECIYALDAVLRERGYRGRPKAWKEGPGYAYYDSDKVMEANGPYHYWLISWKSDLRLYLRIRDATKCLEYLGQCPPSVKEIFLRGDQGCAKHTDDTCTYGQTYTLDGTSYWRCGCCNAPFYFHPVREDIDHYVKLVDLGLNK